MIINYIIKSCKCLIYDIKIYFRTILTYFKVKNLLDKVDFESVKIYNNKIVFVKSNFSRYKLKEYVNLFIFERPDYLDDFCNVLNKESGEDFYCNCKNALEEYKFYLEDVNTNYLEIWKKFDVKTALIKLKENKIVYTKNHSFDYIDNAIIDVLVNKEYNEQEFLDKFSKNKFSLHS